MEEQRPAAFPPPLTRHRKEHPVSNHFSADNLQMAYQGERVVVSRSWYG
jgi:hypothetical protein